MTSQDGKTESVHGQLWEALFLMKGAWEKFVLMAGSELVNGSRENGTHGVTSTEVSLNALQAAVFSLLLVFIFSALHYILDIKEA